MDIRAADWTIEGFLGVAHSFATEIQIDGHPAFTAHYDTKSFEGPLYYAVRGGRWGKSAGWEVELIHLKMFVNNLPPDVQLFSISHGFNLLMLNRGWNLHGFILRTGGGAVLAHPETNIGGVASEQGYDLTGPCGQIVAGRRFYLGRNVFASLEAKFSIARAKVTVATGNASVPSVSLHGLFGLGVEVAD